MFQYLVTVSPLGLMYGSAGAFLAPENLVGRSGAKFPPDAATLSGLFFSAKYSSEIRDRFRDNLVIAGPFWAKQDQIDDFYVPIPWHQVVDESDQDQWRIEQHHWKRDKETVTPAYRWQKVSAWNQPLDHTQVSSNPWQYVSFLHPKLKAEERHVVSEDGLFLENAVQLDDECCLVYLATDAIEDGWYRLGGEGHMVEVNSYPIKPDYPIHELLTQKIDRAFALITPGVWGSKALSYRYPKHPEFPREQIKLLTDKAIPYRYRIGQRKTGRGRLGRGRYAVPAGSVYVLKQSLDRTWWEFPEDWFPKEGFSLKHLGCGLCLPVKIAGVE
ncbi:MAG: CRISPR-associated protein [Leptolyngbya sp. Prado105]|nr:CRISPR-associated protein [Leptolyngbya sp. Prado105]